jgi:urea transporter
LNKSEPQGAEPAYTETRFRPSVARQFWAGICVCLAGLVLLALLNQSVSTGWRLYVIGKSFKAAWAATVALFAATLATTFLRYLAPPEQGGTRFHAISQGLRIIVAALTAIAALGYYLPDWDPWTAALAGLVLLLWILAGLAASLIR